MRDPPVTAYVGLGSNLGDRAAAIRRACDLLAGDPGVTRLRLSTVRETEPVGAPGAPALGGPYLNAAGEVDTLLEPFELLRLCHRVERRLARVRTVRNAPRTIDLDVLLYGAEVVRERVGGLDLEIPHPRLLERGFVLEPLAELCADLAHPVTGRTIGDHWEEYRRRHRGRREAREGCGEDQDATLP